jgi:hypothetical protein
MRGKRRHQQSMTHKDSAIAPPHDQTPMDKKDVDRGNNISVGTGGTNGATTSEDKRNSEGMSSRKRKRHSYSEEGEPMEIDEKEVLNGNAESSDETKPSSARTLYNFGLANAPVASAEIIKLREVFEQEFSLEILLKNEERKAIEAERAKVETSIKQLEQCITAGGIIFLYVFDE